MNINGLQKLTLLDFPGKVACTVFLDGCNFRCPFCHNSGLLEGDAEILMDDTAFFDFLEKRRGVLEGVAVTGGEPLLRDETKSFLKEIKAMGFPVKLDTNGYFPDRLEEIIKEGLADYIAMDIKNSKEKYALTCGVKCLDTDILSRSIGLIMGSGIEYEFRTTCVAQLHDEESFAKIARWIEGAENYYLQSFTDRDTVLFSGFEAPEKEKMLLYRDIVSGFVKHAYLRGI